MSELQSTAYYSFQIINTVSSAAFTFFTGAAQRSTLGSNPQEVYDILGFSPLAVTILHNVLRGQNAALLSTSIYGWVVGPHDRNFYLLAGIVSSFTTYSNVLTLVHHYQHSTIRTAVGLKGSCALVFTSLALAGLNFAAYFFWKEGNERKGSKPYNN